MTADVRQQLTEALDEAELVAATCRADVGPDPEHYPSNIFGFDHAELEFMRAWDPATVLRLVERDRKLLAQCAIYENEKFPDSNGGYADALEDQVDAAAAFWLGTPEPAEDDVLPYDPDDDAEGPDPRDNGIVRPSRGVPVAERTPKRGRLGTPEVDR